MCGDPPQPDNGDVLSADLFIDNNIKSNPAMMDTLLHAIVPDSICTLNLIT